MKASAAVATALVAVVAFGGLLAWVARTPSAPHAATNTPPREAPVAPPPSEFERRRALLPEPNTSAAFVFDGATNWGSLAGTWHVAATPGTFEGRPAWVIDEIEEIPALPGLGTEPTTERGTTWLSRDLRVLHCETVTTCASEKTAMVCTPDGTKVAKTVTGRKPETWTLVAGTAEAKMGLAAALLYLRMCPPATVVDPGVEWTAYPRVVSVEQDGGLRCSFESSCFTFIDLRGSDRAPVRIEEWVGDHPWRTIIARAAPK